MSFTAAVRKYFGMLEGQKLAEFAMELRALTPADKQEFYEYFKSIGMEVDSPMTIKA